MNNWLILGLGNPDKKYEKTKHNVPWWVLDILQKKFSGTKQHLKAIKNLGITNQHRKTFSPINKLK